MTFSSSINICWAGLTMKLLCCYLRISWSNFLLFVGGSLRSAAGPWGHKPTPSHWSCSAQAGTLWQRAGGTYYQRDCSVFPINVTLFVKNCYLIAQLSSEALSTWTEYKKCGIQIAVLCWFRDGRSEFLVLQSGQIFCRSSWNACRAAPPRRSWRSWQTPLTVT